MEIDISTLIIGIIVGVVIGYTISKMVKVDTLTNTVINEETIKWIDYKGREREIIVHRKASNLT